MGCAMGKTNEGNLVLRLPSHPPLPLTHPKRGVNCEKGEP